MLIDRDLSGCLFEATSSALTGTFPSRGRQELGTAAPKAFPLRGRCPEGADEVNPRLTDKSQFVWFATDEKAAALIFEVRQLFHRVWITWT